MKLLSLISRRIKAEQLPVSCPRAVIALGGGGARGLAHLGAMRACADAGLRLNRVVGVSIGGFVGALCAIEDDAEAASQKAIDLVLSTGFRHKQEVLTGAQPTTASESAGGLFSWYGRLRRLFQSHRRLGRVATAQSLLHGHLLDEAVNALIPDIEVEETIIPLSLVAADLRTGRKIVFESGPLRMAVKASMAIPGIFPPVPYNGMLLCDLGVMDSVPIDTARSYPHEIAIAVDVGQGQGAIDEFKTAFDVVMRMEEIGERALRRERLSQADLVIRPHVESVAWFDFSKPRELIEAGYSAAQQQFARVPGCLQEFQRHQASLVRPTRPADVA